MGKQKHAKSDEYFLGQIRELEKQNRRLRQRIKQLERLEHNYNKPKEKQVNKNISKQCSKCGKGELENITVVGRIFERCTLCYYRSKAIKAFRKK